MRLFGRTISKWWLLLVIPLVVVGAPVLLPFFFIGNGLIGGLVGPPAIWNRSWHTASREDLIGRYVESERHWDRVKTGADSVLELRSDGTISVAALPDDSITSSCTLSGGGRWSSPDEWNKFSLEVVSDNSPDSCPSGSYSLIEVVGRSKPYDLYWVLGDPDSGTGVWLKRQ